MHDGKRGHLSSGFDLEGADSIGAAEEVISSGIIFGDLSEIDGAAALFANAEGIFHGREHAQPEEVDFDNTEVFAVVLVPLQDGAPGHGGGLERDDLIEPVVTKDHAAGMLSEVTGGVENVVIELQECVEAGMVGGNSGALDGVAKIHDLTARVVVVHREFFGRLLLLGVLNLGRGTEFGEAIGDCFREAKNLGHFPEGGARFVGDDIGRHRRAVWGVFFEKILDDGFAPLAGGEVDIDIGPGLAVF